MMASVMLLLTTDSDLTSSVHIKIHVRSARIRLTVHNVIGYVANRPIQIKYTVLTSQF